MPGVVIATLAFVVFVADPAESASNAIEAALREVLGSGVDVRLVSVANTFEAGRNDLATYDPDVQAWVTWSDGGRSAVLALRVVGAPERRTSLRFSSQDDSVERGRTVGYVLASWLPREQVAQRVVSPAPETDEFEAAPPATLPTPSSAPLPSPRYDPWVRSLAAYGVFSFGWFDHGATTSYGGGAVASLAISPRVALQARVEARTGHVGPAQASASFLSATLGARLQLVRFSRRLDLGAELQLGFARDALSHFSADDPTPVERSRLLGLADARLEVGWRFASTTALCAAIGADLGWGTTTVFVRDAKRATLGSVRPLAGLGFSTGF